MQIMIQNRSRIKIEQRKVKGWVSLILKKLSYIDSEISILFLDDDDIQVLNKKYRRKNKPTDVLSFSQVEGKKNSELKIPNSKFQIPNLLGDVVISLETAKRQAKERGHPFKKEVIILLIHGILHLLGYDHEGNRKMAVEMRRKEEEIIKLATDFH